MSYMEGALFYYCGKRAMVRIYWTNGNTGRRFPRDYKTQSPRPRITIPLLSFTLDLIFSPTPSNKIVASTIAYAATSPASTAAYAASVVSFFASACPPQEIFSLVDQISSSRTKATAATDAYAAFVVSSVASACPPLT
ncbi:hypothetical protein Salat_2670400 [Sesamum alatum]|uniref:Uncharacterized protein n=1 Tax=Sesamum alatum TaxID=300844 RepID=A0AAE1XPF2_9LAMI|nr:hypothetical protein Salat_2670400 [Sesamum alatum]